MDNYVVVNNNSGNNIWSNEINITILTWKILKNMQV